MRKLREDAFILRTNNGDIWQVDDSHTLEEYRKIYGGMYDEGELWDFSEEDVKSGAVDAQPNMIYWRIVVGGEPRYFETNSFDEWDISECREELGEDCEKLEEGTSNFPTRSDFDLLVFYTMDEFYDRMRYDSNYPDEDDFEHEDEQGHYYIDWEAYDEAKEKFEQEYWDNNELCVLDEDEVERLENKLYDFNSETQSIADERYDYDFEDNDERTYDDLANLEDIKLKIESGYYEAAYIDVDNEDAINYMGKEFGAKQRERIENFLKELRSEFGLTKLEVAWGPASNGETGFKILKDSLEEKSKEEEKCEKDSCKEELDKKTIYIKYWEDEELRDQGISEIYLDKFEDIEEAKSVAKKLIDRDGFASVEVMVAPNGEVESKDDYVVWGYDGVDTWTESLDMKEQLFKEALLDEDLTVNDFYKELINIIENYIEDLENGEDDALDGEDSYANEMLGQHLWNLISQLPSSDEKKDALYNKIMNSAMRDPKGFSGYLTIRFGESLKEEKIEEKENKNNFKDLTIEEMFFEVAGKKFNVFDENGHFTKQAYELYDEVAKRYGSVDEFDALCGSEGCFEDDEDIQYTANELKESPENPSTHLGYKEDGEEVIKQAGHAYLLKKGNRYIVRYAPGYYVNDIKASSDEEAINKFLGLDESIQKLAERKSKKKLKFRYTGDPAKDAAFFNHCQGTDVGDVGVETSSVSLGEDEKICESQDDYYVVSDGKNPKHSYVFSENGRETAIGMLKDYKGNGYWEVLHYVNGNPIMIYNTKDGAIEEK